MPKRSSTPRPPRPAGKVVRKDGRVLHVHYTPAVAEEICERISGGEIWYRICNTGRLPSYRSLYVWTKRYPEFAEAYAQAQEIAAHARFEKALVVAEDSTAATVQADRLHVSTLKWHAEALAPDVYGVRRRVGEREAPMVILQEYRRDPLGGPAIPIFDVTPQQARDGAGGGVAGDDLAGEGEGER
jgi:hypothetical protein